jgi:hypothetical protein
MENITDIPKFFYLKSIHSSRVLNMNKSTSQANI